MDADTVIIELQSEIDRLRVENIELRKVYLGVCPECGYRGCVRGRKACDLKIDQLEAELQIALSKTSTDKPIHEWTSVLREDAENS